MILNFRKANINDAQLYFDWANDKTVRKNSYNQSAIDYNTHVKWFNAKLNSPDCFFYLFTNEDNEPVGQVRIDKTNNEVVIGISIDEKYRGKRLGVEMLNRACSDYFSLFADAEIKAYIKTENTASIKLFTHAGFKKIAETKIGKDNSLIFTRIKK